MNRTRLRKILKYLPGALIPGSVRSLGILLRTGSVVSPSADILHPSRVSIGGSCLIDGCLIDANTSSKPGIVIGDSCLIHRNNVLRTTGAGTIRIGNNTSIQSFSIVYGIGNTLIGDNVLIASHCAIGVARHRFAEKGVLIADQEVDASTTVIGGNVWLGAHVTVFSGVTVGEGAVIGAGAVVTKDIPPYSVAVGMPARVIRSR